MADEALVCFQTLLESVPAWIADLESTLTSAAERQQEFLASNHPVLLQPQHDENAATIDIPVVQHPSQLLAQQTTHLTNSDVLRFSQRKRKTASVCSRADSQPSKYRSMSQAFVHYDGQCQKKFESLVRAIGTSRNAIRKGKLSVKIDAMTRTGSSSSSSSSAGEETIKGLGTFSYRSTTTMRRPDRASSKHDSTKALDTLDSCLEQAQVSIERAAHQILRDGDCTPEIDKARELFRESITVIKAEVPLLQRNAEKTQRRRESEERRLGEDRLQFSSVAGLSFGNNRNSLPSDGLLEVDNEHAADDEDDGDDESQDFDVSAMVLPPQLGKFRLARDGGNRPPVTMAVH